MQDAKLKVKLMSTAHKNKSLSATLPSNGARKVLDNPQVQGIAVTPLNLEVWGIEPQEQEGKTNYPLQLECHNSSCLCTKQIKETMEVDLMQESDVQQNSN